MSENPVSLAGRVQHHLKKRLFAGLLVLVPLVITFLIIRFLFEAMSGLLAPVIAHLAPDLPSVVVDIISFGVLVGVMYLAGVLTAYLVGRRIIALGEAVVTRIPLVKTIYSAIRQVMDSFTFSNRREFKSVVWVEFPRPGFLALGFVTGKMADESGKQYYKLFIPTAPNPTTGFFEVVPCEHVRETAIAVEDAMKMIISGGILSPTTLAGHCLPPPTGSDAGK